MSFFPPDIVSYNGLYASSFYREGHFEPALHYFLSGATETTLTSNHYGNICRFIRTDQEDILSAGTISSVYSPLHNPITRHE